METMPGATAHTPENMPCRGESVNPNGGSTREVIIKLKIIQKTELIPMPLN